ncbi:hypothetical protein ACFQE1_02195 [Halobium palmae]|uniref:Uncharacterized protein n=1 Tax=Halobium palmae TaxID=1776492 RepID=A0ABD5RVP9_9EURY
MGVEVAVIKGADWTVDYRDEVFRDRGTTLIRHPNVPNLVSYLVACDNDVFVERSLLD